MPELPEVEVTRQSFARRIHGAQIHAVRLGTPLRWPLGCSPDSLVSQAVGDVTRRGKYLWLALDRGGLLMHLGMSGSLAFDAAPAAPGPHDHFDLVTARGTLRLTDPRRFGAVVWSPARDTGAAGKLLAGLGLEPFDPAFTGAHLHAALRGRRIAILGDMLELGATEAALHAAIADHPSLASIDLIHCVGPRMQALWLALPRAQRGEWAQSAADLVPRARSLIDAGDIVLVKGSKGIKVSLVVDALVKMGQGPVPIEGSV